MNSLSLAQTLLLIVGILGVVVGAGLVVEGHNQQQAADEWASQLRYCGSGNPGEVSCPTNPYSGGGAKMFGGFVALLIGGGLAYLGTR